MWWWGLGAGMAAAASEEEQGKVVDMVPAAPAPDPQQQPEERDVTAHQDSKEEAKAADKIEEVLRLLQRLRERISQLLGPAGPHRAVDVAGRRCLAFMETELTITVAFLTTLSPQHLDVETKKWLQSLEHIHVWAYRFPHEVDPSRQTSTSHARIIKVSRIKPHMYGCMEMWGKRDWMLRIIRPSPIAPQYCPSSL